MKLLYFVRHAKAVSQDSGPNDFKRSLSKQGLKDAQAMGERLKQKGVLPDLLVSSPANRARETAHIFAQEMDSPVQDILLKDEFYDDNAAIILEVLKSLPGGPDSVMLFGHEPVLSHLAALFLQETEIEFTTSTVLGIALEIESWQELAGASGTLVFSDFPARATPKVYKKAKKKLAGEITAAMKNMLEEIESGSSGQLENLLEKTGEKLAKHLTKVLHASKVEDIAKIKQKRQRLDTREEFESGFSAGAASEKTPQSQESVADSVNVPKRSAPVAEEALSTNDESESSTSTEQKSSDTSAGSTSTPKRTPARRSTRRKRATPIQADASEEAVQTTQAEGTEEKPPAPKTSTRRRSTRRKASETNKSPATRRKRTKNVTTNSDAPTNVEEN